MRWTFYLVIAAFLTLYAGITFYVGWRGWLHLFRYLPHLPAALYWALLALAAAALFLQRLAGAWLPPFLDTALAWIGSYWMGILFYLFLLILAADLVGALGRLLPIQLAGDPGQAQQAVAWSILLVVIALQVYGTWNAQQTVIQPYRITVAKNGGSLGELHIVLVSDIHLDKIVGPRRLQKMVDLINRQEPDIVLLAGDVIDSSIEVFAQSQIRTILAGIKTRYGVYAVPGNHEYISGKLAEFISQMDQAGIQVLRDERLLVADSFYLLGRDEDGGYPGSQARLPLATLLAGADMSRPVIILDHTPRDLAEGAAAGADLQLSGHTHRGQLFPNQWLTRRIFENDYGYLKKAGLQVIVSSGYGTWGPPIRLGSRSEIVDIRVTWSGPAAPAP